MMRLLLVALFIFGTKEQIAAQIESHAVIVHFKQGSLLASSWLDNGRQGTVKEFATIIGNHTSIGFVSTPTLVALQRAWEQRTSMHKKSSGSALELIAIVRYTKDIHPAIASKKLSSIRGVEICEPLPLYSIVSTTNDPLLNQQYYIDLVKASDAWDSIPAGKPLLVGVTDTGVDTSHVDLHDVIWNNPGETGLDGQGRDKRSNGIDDDGNGFADDWYGWDFVGSNGQTGDNSPLPGNPHGTHVSGIIAAVHNNAEGVAGVASNVRILPVKIGADDQFSNSISHSADAIIYAASMGASVINCSFGSASSSFADVKVIREATALGALIVAAAGNDGQDLAYYPAAYDQVVSVAATDNNDRVAAFSNVHQSVDVCAPGVAILSTVPNNRYESYNGTSMATPVVAGLAAMVRQVHPEFTPAQVHATLRASCVNIDALNLGYDGLIGNGRVNAPNAVSHTGLTWASVNAHTFTDSDNDSVFESNDTLRLHFSIANSLQPLDSCTVRISNGNPSISITILDTIVTFGRVSEGAIVSSPIPVRCILPLNLPPNGIVKLLATLYEGSQRVSVSALQTVVNPTYRTMKPNDIAVTVNSSGNIGFNDYSSNTQGIGIHYLDHPNILFEGALMIGTSPAYLPNVARGVETSTKEASFRTLTSAQIRTDSIPSGARIVTSFNDQDDPYPLGVKIHQNVIGLNNDSTKNALLIVVRVTNTTDTAFTNLHVTEFFDFDIGDGGEDNLCVWDSDNGMLYTENVHESGLTNVGVAMISPLPINAFALNNAGATDCPSIYDEFVRTEKWLVMTGGLRRTRSTIGDVSCAIGAGPISLPADSTVEVCFVLSAGMSVDAVRKGLRGTIDAAKRLGKNVGQFTVQESDDAIISLAGGTIQQPGDRDLRIRITTPTNLAVRLFDVRGRIVSELANEPYIDAGIYDLSITLPEVSAGLYFLQLSTSRSTSSIPLFISTAE